MWRKLGIKPGEGRVFAWGVAVLFLVGWTDVLLKNLSETLFVKRVGFEWMPWAFLVSALLLVLSTGLIARVAARSDRLRLLPRAMLVMAAGLLPLWVLLPLAETAVPWVLIVSEKQITSITVLIFWVAMGDLLHGRQAKRLFGPMVAGMTLGMTLGSEASRQVGLHFGVAALIPFAALSLALGALVSLPLRRARPRLAAPAALPARAEADEPGRHPPWVLWRESSLFRLVFLIALASGLVGPMLYVQFQYVADAGNPGEASFLSFVSLVRAWLGAVTLVAQLFLVSWLYRRIGIPLSIALSPVAYLASFLGLSVRLTALVGSVAHVGTKLSDNAVYDPALRVIYNLFPEEIRASAASQLEGPARRFGGALGNVLNVVAVGFGSARWIGYLALPIAAVWMLAALKLWRQYPRLLLAASARRAGLREALQEPALLDAATVRALLPELVSQDARRAQVAIDLVAEAPPERSVPVLVEALERAPRHRRSAIIAALDRLLEHSVTAPVRNASAAQRLERVLEEAGEFGERDHADLVQAYGRLQVGEGGVAQLRQAFEQGRPAVRLAALAALTERGVAEPGDDLDRALADALRAGGEAARTAREELRARLLCGEPDALWEQRLAVLAGLLDDPQQRAPAAEALAEVAERHGEWVRACASRVLAHREDPDPRLRAALLRFCGYAGLEEQAGWLVDHIGSERPVWNAAAREGLRALGPMSSRTLLRELSYGGRSRRDGILEVMRELQTEPETLRALYQQELDTLERDLLHIHSVRDRPVFALLRQRLEERVGEKLHTALLFLAAIRHEARIAELGDRLRDPSNESRRQAIVLEALEATLHSEEKVRLIPILEDGALLDKAARLARSRAAPSFDQSLAELLKDADELTRSIAAGLALAAGFEVEDHEDVDAVEKMLHLKALPIFEGLTARQLMNLARKVKEETVRGGEVVVTEGDCDDRLFLVVEGVIHIVRGETLLAEMGPGDFFGEIALFEGTARTATARAQTRVRLLVLERADLLSLLEEMPGIAVVLLQTLSRRVRELTDRLMV